MLFAQIPPRRASSIRRASLALLLTLSFILPSLPLAAQQPVIGLVDLSAVLIFHPRMANYDPVRGSFQNDESLKTVKRTKPLAQIDVRKAIEELSSRKSRIETQLNDIRRKMNEKLRQEATSFGERILNVSTGTAAVLENRNLIRISQIDQEFSLKARGLFGELKEIDKELATLEKTDPTGTWSSPEETQQIFKVLLAEVKDVVKWIASAKRIGIVLDAGPSYTFQTHQESNEPIMVPNDNPLKAALTEPPPPSSEPKEVSQKHFQAIGEGIFHWVRNRTAVLTPIRAALTSSKVILGGVDMTEDVIATLLTRYKVNQSVQWVILNAYRLSR